MSNFFDALGMVDEVKPNRIEYRLYYNAETGEPLFYSMDDEEGDYILVSKEQFAECRYNVKVKNGEMKLISGIAIGKLVPFPTGYGTTKTDISIVSDEQYWSLKTYEND